jgi:hypothetical protein
LHGVSLLKRQITRTVSENQANKSEDIIPEENKLKLSTIINLFSSSELFLI